MMPLLKVLSYLWLCDGASQLSGPKSALWCLLIRWPDTLNKHGKIMKMLTKHNLESVNRLIPRQGSYWSYRNSLSRRTESSGDHCLCVSLQRAGAAGHGPNPEHSLRLVHHWQNLLRLHRESLNTGSKTGHHLCLSTHKKCQRHRLLLEQVMSHNTYLKAFE